MPLKTLKYPKKYLKYPKFGTFMQNWDFFGTKSQIWDFIGAPASIWFWFLSKKFKLSELRRHLLSLQHSVSGRGAAPGLVDSQKNITHLCNGRQWTNERQPRRKGTTTDSQGTRLKGVMAICATQSSTIRLLPFIFVQPSGKNFQFNLLVQNDERNYSQTCLETTCYYSNIWFDGTALQTVALENG